MKLDKPIKRNNNTSDSVVGTVVAVDLPPFLRPDYSDRVSWPKDITQLTAQNVSELLGKYTEIICYAESQLAKYKQAILTMEDHISLHTIRIIEEEPHITGLEKNKRDMKIASDAGMCKMKSRLRALKRCEVAAEMFVKNYERRLTALSRELSRKTASGDGLRYARTGKE